MILDQATRDWVRALCAARRVRTFDVDPQIGAMGVLRAFDAPGVALGAVAMDAGYADQAHMTRECAKLAGTTPGALLASKLGRAAIE